jgi:very-short-patch-repair endonuclease
MSYASHLRANQTDAEKHLWHQLRNRQLAGFKFRRQLSLPPYIVDFACLECRLIIEVDGGQHANEVIYDTERSEHFLKQGYRVLRFWNNEVLGNLNGVLERVLQELNITTPHSSPLTPHPGPLPQGERE